MAFRRPPPSASPSHGDGHRNYMAESSKPRDGVAAKFFANSSATRVNTDAFIYEAIVNEHPGINVTITPERGQNLKSYAASTGNAIVQSLESESVKGSKHVVPSDMKWKMFVPPFKRLDGGDGVLAEEVFFEKFIYHWKDFEFLVYLVEGRDEEMPYQAIRNQYIVSNEEDAVDLLIETVGRWDSVLHEEIWVFEQGWWQKSRELYLSTKNASWDNVILHEDMKKDLVDTASRFYDSHDVYKKLRVPWKRGIIFYGPPGNGKTISIKATMHTLYQRSPPIPTMYVKTLTSFAGPEYSISLIFEKARQEAPCYLVFEDLDSLIKPEARSFFLNAVDGLSENEGILMVGSTNHLEQLDPGISKRPSRFDRKYLFPDPDESQRTQYCHYWQEKLSDNKEIEFPDKLCPAIAKITDGFSMAYIQEAFVSSLLSIARQQHDHRDKPATIEAIQDSWDILDISDSPEDGGDGDNDEELNKYILWREIKEQIKTLRKEISDDKLEME